MRRVLMTAAAAAAFLLPGHIAVIALLAFTWYSAMTTTNTAKTRTLEGRVDGIVSAQTTVNTTLASLQTAVTALNEGTFTNVDGFTVSMVAGQNATLHAGVLSYFTQDSNSQFLAGLAVATVPTSPGTAPGSYSQSFEQANYTGGLNSVIAAGQAVGIW